MELKEIIRIIKEALQEAGVKFIVHRGKIICWVDSVDTEKIANFIIKKDIKNETITLYYNNKKDV